MTIELDHGVPVPVLRRNRKYPWAAMKIAPGSNPGGFASMAKRYGMKVAYRSRTENGVDGVRVWRIE